MASGLTPCRCPSPLNATPLHECHALHGPFRTIDPDLGELPQSSEILPEMQISQRSLTILVDFSADSSFVVHQNIEAAELADRLVDQFIAELLISNISGGAPPPSVPRP